MPAAGVSVLDDVRCGDKEVTKNAALFFRVQIAYRWP